MVSACTGGCASISVRLAHALQNNVKRMEILNLLAEHGDAFVIKTLSSGNPYTIVVDGGPGSTDELISSYYRRLGFIDLMILTHFDEDHIAGLKNYVKAYKDSKLPVGRFWGNCAQGVDMTDPLISDAGNRNAGTLAHYLRLNKEANPESFEWREDIKAPLEYTPSDIRIRVLSPDGLTFTTLKAEYEEYLKKHPIVIDDEEEVDDANIASVRVDTDAKKIIEQLSSTDTQRRVNLMNRSSIAFLLEAEGKKILMLGDADAEIVANSIESLGEPLPLKVDLVKASHHGSLNSISKHLLNVIDCDNYVFSTNGGTGRSYHPDRKTLALILRKPHRNGREINFYFNYPMATIKSRTGILLSDDEKVAEKCNIIDDTVRIVL